MKKILTVLIPMLLMLGLLAGCAGNTEAAPDATQITLSDDGIKINGGGAKAEGSVVTIGAVGSYSVSGSLSDGQIVVDTGDEAVNVTLILNGVDITSLSGPAIHIRQAKDARLELAEGSQNRVVSGVEADMDKNDADSSGAAIYAEDDLDIEGEGSLEVYGYINNGIACKDDLDINSGTIRVLAANNGIRGAKSVEIKGGNVTVDAAGDGVKSSSDKVGKGYVTVQGGSLSVTAGGDGISAETELTVSGGTLTIAATGDPGQVSSKALKAQTGLVISGGEMYLSSADHAIRSGAELTVSGGKITANATDGKAMAAHGNIVIGGGELTLDSEKDGIETPGDITISGGTITLTAGDDGLQAGQANSGQGTVTVSGGEVRVSAKGQAVNARGELLLDGGSLIALGGSGKAPSPGGGQMFLSLGWTAYAGNQITLADREGTIIAEAVARQPFKHILITLPELTAKTDYTLTNGANSTTVRCTEKQTEP